MSLVEKSSLKTEVPKFDVGDTVDVHCRILEGDKERVQIFNGLVIARAGSGSRETFTVRRIVAGRGRRAEVPHSFAAHRQGRGETVGRDPPRQTVLSPRPHRQGRPPERTPHHGGKKVGTAQSSAVRRWKCVTAGRSEESSRRRQSAKILRRYENLRLRFGLRLRRRSIATRSVSEGVACAVAHCSPKRERGGACPLFRPMFTRPLEIPSSAFRPLRIRGVQHLDANEIVVGVVIEDDAGLVLDCFPPPAPTSIRKSEYPSSHCRSLSCVFPNGRNRHLARP